MKTAYINTGSTARLSADIDDLFNQLERVACKACDSTVYPGVLSPDGYCLDCLAYDLAAAPAPVVPTPLGSQRPNADNAVYRHQSVINSVFKIPFSPDAEFKTLCHKCLRVVCHPTYQAMEMAHNEFFFCDCGGQLCAWDGASEIADLLARQGSTVIPELIRLRLIKPIAASFIYSPATGIVREQSK